MSGWGEFVGIGTGLLGGITGADDDRRAQVLRELAASEFSDAMLPEIGRLQAREAGDSALADSDDISAVLQQLQEQYESGGMTAGDVAAQRAAGRDVSRRAASRSATLARETAGRGMNSAAGAALASQAGQDELEALASLEADIAAQGRNRALQALQARGQLAQQVGSAQDLQNRFNASQRQTADAWNISIPQQQFDNRMAMLAQRNAAREGVALGHNRAAQSARDLAAGVGNAAVTWSSKEDEDD